MIIAGLLHILVATFVAYALALLNGSLTSWIAITSLLIGVGIAWWRTPSLTTSFKEWRFNAFSPGAAGWIERVLFVFILYLAWRHFAFLLYVGDKEIRTLSKNNFGDLPLHINYIRQFAQGYEFPPINPEFGGDLLRYPFGVDFYSALWEAVGVPTPAHLFLFGIFASIATLVALRAWAGWWGVGGLFLSGGWAGWEFFKQGRFMDIEDSLAWKNLFLSVFITQRGMLYALPAGLLVLDFARRAFQGDISPSARQIRWMGLLWGSLALFHLHAFVIVSLILAGLALIHRDRGVSLALGTRLCLWALPAGIAFTAYSTNFFRKASVAHWRAGWMSGPEGITRFLNLNFGPYLLLALAIPLIIMALRHAPMQREARKGFLEWVLYIGLFALFMNVMLAPWEWDNVKVLIWPYLGLLSVAQLAFRPAADTKWGKIAQPALAFILFFSGTVTVLRASQSTQGATQLFSLKDIASTEGALKSVPSHAVFAASTSHNHTLTWAGRRRVLGYEGHLWSHGINPQRELADLQILMRGSDGWADAAKRLGVTHIFWGPMERQAFHGADPTWISQLPNISSVAGYEIYEIPQDKAAK